MDDDAYKVYRLTCHEARSKKSIGWANGNSPATVAEELTHIYDTQISTTNWKGRL